MFSRQMQTRLRMVMALALVLVTVAVQAVPASAQPRVTTLPGGWQMETFVEPDGTRVERGAFRGAEFETRYEGTTVINTIRVGNREEVVVSDRTSPEFTITTNGHTKVYRRDQVAADLELPEQTGKGMFARPRQSTHLGARSIGGDGLVQTQDASDWLGDPYSRKFLMSKSVYDPIYVGGALYEDYYYYLTEYNNKYYEAFTYVSLILGVFSMGMSTWLQIAGSITVLVNGVLVINDAVTVEENAYKRVWFKYVEIGQDPNDGIWYNASREQIVSRFVAIDDPAIEVKSEDAHYDFYDNEALIDTGINNYIDSVCGFTRLNCPE